MRSRVLATAVLVTLLAGGVLLWAPWTEEEQDLGSVLDRPDDGNPERSGDARVEPSLRGSGVTPPVPARPGPPGTPEPTRPLLAPAGFEAQPGRITGRLTDADGEPVAGARVTVHSGAWTSRTEPAFGVQVETDADGWFRADGVPDAKKPYRVYVQRDDGYQAVWLGRPGDPPAALVLFHTFTIAGRLVPERPDVPVAGVTLRFRREGATQAEFGRLVQTEEDGSFLADSLLDAPHVLTIYRLGSAGPEDPSTLLMPVRIDNVAAGTEDLAVVVRLGRVIAGELRGPDGVLVTHPVAVELVGRTAHGDTDYSRRLRARVGDGTFRFTGLADGEYTLTFKPVRKAEDEPANGISARTLDRVLAGTESLVVDLWGGEAVHGYLMDEDGQEVRATGHLYVHPEGTAPGGPEAAIIGMKDESRFRTVPLDPGRTYGILVSGFDGYMGQHLHGIRPGAQEIVIRLESARRIQGRIVSADGSPLVPFVPVLARAVGDTAGQPGAQKAGYADAEGRFTLDGLGEFEFELQAGGAETGRVGTGPYPTVEVGATEVVLKVVKGVAFSGRLVDAAGDPVKTSYVSVSAVTGKRGIACTATIEGEDGRFAFAGVPPGRVRFVARVGGEYVRLGEFDAPATDVTVRVP